MQGFFWEGDIENNYIGHICAEVWKDKIFNKFLIGKKDLIICDIGAHVGITSFYFSKFAKIVYSLEPSAEHYPVLVHMVRFNQLQNVQLFKLAVSNENGQKEFFHDINKTMYSLNPARRITELPTEIVETVTLEKFFEDNKIEKCDFVKLDVEGSEQEIIGGLPFTKVAPKIQTILLEYHPWSNRHPHQIMEALKNNGFTGTGFNIGANIIVGTKDE